ncbi:glycoside hydrolase family 19 protein [Acidocella facilis]|uniref:glycoside hydrolase family 19 protein n=1 Tax=Acidocella facilis TaxID=525 RepID=UPI001F39C984|nr:glycoside hydrolase family 19 protein [Acidocella facilis]
MHAPATAADVNLWYAQRYAVAAGLAQPSQLSVCSFGTVSINADLLCSIMPPLTRAKANEFAPWMNTYLFRYDINTIPRLSAFIGNTAVESGYYQNLVEYMGYSADGLRKTFPHEFKTKEVAEKYAQKPEAIANRAYANRNGNGDEASGDGWKYRGRGVIQVSGRNNYAAFSRFSHIDVVANPDLMAEPQYAVWSAVWFWNLNRLNGYADLHQFEKLASIINGPTPPNNWPQRQLYQRRAAQIITERLLSHARL